jgi:hypothetical protein
MWLERALLFTFAMHGLGILSMATCLLPGMPGGGTPDDAARIHYIASHPWIWRLGWLPWQLTALSDLLLATALLKTRWIPRAPALITLLVTIAAVIPDQMGQIAWITRGIHLAQTDPSLYIEYEKRIFHWTAAWGATLYCFGALGWTWCLAASGTWTRLLTILSAILWPLFLFVCIGPFFDLNPGIVAAGNGIGFFLLQLWFILVTEQVMRRARPQTTYGRYAEWRHPRFAFLNPIANSRFLRACAGLLPPVAFRSDITDVIYINYIVNAGRLAPLVPEGLELQRLGPNQDHALFTFLTYRHGGFGPGFLGPLRRMLPSPIHTNWRIHVFDPRTGSKGIHFITNAISSTPHALAARMLSEGMPMHVLQNAEVSASRVRFDGGSGSAPDCDAVLQPAAAPEDGPWRRCFDTWVEFLAYAVPQDRALSTQPWRRRVTRQEIDLGIPLDICEPLAGTVSSRAAAAITGDAKPFCFRVPKVSFLFEREEYDDLPDTKTTQL